MSEIYFLAAGLIIATVFMVVFRMVAGWRIWKLWKTNMEDAGGRYDPEKQDSTQPNAERS